jgi:hypothetical protein
MATEIEPLAARLYGYKHGAGQVLRSIGADSQADPCPKKKTIRPAVMSSRRANGG